MKEAFLYYLWENRLLTGTLTTSGEQPVQIINPGYRNTNSGPDFLEAKIKIGAQLWAGHVEIHVKTSDWNRHGHQLDKAYGNVVLHVVYEHDTTVNGIPVLELKGHFDETLYAHYERLIASQHWIACERNLEQVSPFVKLTCLDRMAVERLEEKSHVVTKLLETNKFDWEDTLYRLLLRYFGLKVNNEAFEYLANLVPFKTLLKHADNLVQVEAMLLGCAGFLDLESDEDYIQLLKREFAVMRAKFNLLTMPVERWKFMRMRPVNFPTVRLAQLAQMIHQHGCLFSKIKEAENVAEAKQLFDVKASAYWDTHYRFSVDGPARPKHLGEATADVLMINAVVPLLFCYGKFHKEERYCEKALRFLEDIDAEDNSIIRSFAGSGVTASNAMQTQALLHLYNMFCKRKRCLECQIGNVLVRS
ncbi:MAG: DUF2851 family protein [Bacteroidales bacterium]|nr:DUF2851 family protein [Bacteroidales bacterium]